MRAVKPKRPPKPPKALAAIAAAGVDSAVAMLFWKLRNYYPEFAMTFTETEIRHFKASLAYQDQVPKIVLEAKAQHVVLRIEDDKTGDMIRVSESTEADLDAAEAAKKLRRVKEQMPNLVAAVMGEWNQGTTSQESITSLCNAATMLARA